MPKFQLATNDKVKNRSQRHGTLPGSRKDFTYLTSPLLVFESGFCQ